MSGAAGFSRLPAENGVRAFQLGLRVAQFEECTEVASGLVEVFGAG